MSLTERQLDITKTEWGFCEVGIARFDTLSYQTRTWAITAFVAIIAASASMKVLYILCVAPLVTSLFWFVDAHTRAFQRLAIQRSHAIQTALCAYVQNGEFSEEFIKGKTISGLFDEKSRSRGIEQLRYLLKSGLRGNVVLFYGALQLVSVAAFIILASRK